MQLTLTDRAAKAVIQRAQDADVAGWLLRVAIVAGGCNGLTYELYFVPEAGAEDTVVETGGVKIAIDRATAPLLDGTVIDFPGGASFAGDGRSPKGRSIGEPSFRFDNPRAR